MKKIVAGEMDERDLLHWGREGAAGETEDMRGDTGGEAGGAAAAVVEEVEEEEEEEEEGGPDRSMSPSRRPPRRAPKHAPAEEEEEEENDAAPPLPHPAPSPRSLTPPSRRTGPAAETSDVVKYKQWEQAQDKRAAPQVWSAAIPKKRPGGDKASV